MKRKIIGAAIFFIGLLSAARGCFGIYRLTALTGGSGGVYIGEMAESTAISLFFAFSGILVYLGKPIKNIITGICILFLLFGIFCTAGGVHCLKMSSIISSKKDSQLPGLNALAGIEYTLSAYIYFFQSILFLLTAGFGNTFVRKKIFGKISVAFGIFGAISFALIYLRLTGGGLSHITVWVCYTVLVIWQMRKNKEEQI